MIRRIMLAFRGRFRFKRIILHFISIMLFSLQNLFIIPYVSTSLAEFIDFYAVTFSPKFLCATAPLKFITLSLRSFSSVPFQNLPILLRSSLFKISQFLIPFFSPKNVPISPTTRSKVGVQSHAKSPSKPKKHRCSTKQTYLGPLGFLHLGELSDNYSTGDYKGDRQNSLSQHSVPSFSLSLFLSSISPCNKLAIVLAETTSINICG